MVQLVGPDALQDRDRATLELGRMLREDFLQQNAFSEVDAFCSTEKQMMYLDAHIRFYGSIGQYLENGHTLDEVLELPLREELAGLKNYPDDEFREKIGVFYQDMEKFLT